MNAPLSFVPDQQAQNAPSTFVPDQQAKPQSFVPDGQAPVAFQNRTPQNPALQIGSGYVPQTYGDAMASKSPLNVGSPGEQLTGQQLANAPLQLLGQAVAGLLNEMANKSAPDVQYAQPGTGNVRSGLQQRLFGPSNLSTLGKDPNQEMFKQGQSLLPMETKQVGADSDARRMAESMTTPEGLASVPLGMSEAGPLVTAAYGASTAANLPDMSKADIAANALMMGLPMARGLHESISRSSDITPREEPALPKTDMVQSTSNPDSITAADSIMLVGGDKDSGIAGFNDKADTISRGTLSPADLGKEMGLTVKQWPDETPVIGGSYSLTDPKTGYTIENLRDGVTKEEVQSRLDAKQKEVGELFGNQGHSPENGSVGLHVLDPEMWKELGFKAKVGGEQFVNRLRNKLGGDSAGWKLIDTPEFQSFMNGGPKTTQEVQDWVNSNGPKVEVKKFGAVGQDTQTKRLAEITHEVDTKYPNYAIAGANGQVDFYEGSKSTTFDPERIPDEKLKSLMLEYRDLQKTRDLSTASYSHWQSIAPKSEKDMPGYTEIAVVKPVKKMSYEEYLKDVGKIKGDDVSKKYYEEKLQGRQLNKEQFPSSHSFPPNTLGFARGYMEHTADGKKIFHVIEVQSDWAQKYREEGGNQQELNFQRRYGVQGDPLLPHYERLALKAAIDHAREQGADSIAISDAETAMLTEGHDQASAAVRAVGDQPLNESHITQAAGMRLHYDKTLPKIAEELTGEKGTKESFGEHRMAMDDPYGRFDEASQNASTKSPRKDLIFKNESGEPKTDITARVYPIKKAASDFSIISKDKPRISNQGQTPESGAINLDAIREGLGNASDAVKEFFSDEGIRRKTMKMAGVSVPRTTSQNEAVGNQLAMFAQAEGVAEAKARSMVSEVLGKHWKDSEFANKLGAVGVEDQLRTLKAQLLAKGKTAEAMSVNTVVGQPYSPIKSEAQYQMLKNAPDIKAALARHIATVQDLAEQKQSALKGALRAPGQDTGSFFNLIAKGVDDGTIPSARNGNPLATLKGGTRFGKEFKGTGTEYETDYRKMAERMVKGNWTEVEKQKLFDLVDKTGFGHLQKAGEDLPTFDKPMSPIPVQRRMAVIIKPGDKPIMKNQNETLWVPKDTAEEFRQAFQTDSPIKSQLLQGIGGLNTRIQTAAGADAAIHVSNLAAAIVTSPEKATAVKYALKNMMDTFETNPGVQKRLADMAEEAGIVRQGEDEVSAWKKLIPGKHMISWVDQIGRLTFDQLYKDAIKRGESPDSPIWRRAAVQGNLGEYNKRLASKLQQTMKELGISPFLVAGKNLNRLSLKQLALSPGRKSLDAQGGAKMRLRQALYATGLLVATPMIVNKMVTGNPFPKGVQPGQIVVKKNEDGSYVTWDIAKLLMWRRGLRNSGIQAMAQGIEDKQSIGQIAKQAGKDIGRGIAHPFAGPLVSTADTALGSGIMSDRADKPLSGRLVDAAKQLNPTATMLLDSDATKTTGEKAIKGIGGTVGLKVTPSHVSRISQLAHEWMERNGVPTGNEPAGPYRDLTAALRKNDAGAARQAVGQLIASGKTDKEIKQYYSEIPQRNFTDSKKHEAAFVGELSPEDQQVYQSVKDSNKVVRNRFYQMFLPNMPIPRDPLPSRPSLPERPTRFPLQH